MRICIDGMYGGVAPNAKIAFFDLAGSSGGLVGVQASGLYAPGRAAGARIHTNSWGSYYGQQPYYAGQDVDQYLFNNPVRS